MGRWDDVLSRSDAESIHAYIVDEAWKAYKAQAARDPSAAGNPTPVDAATLGHIFRAAVAGDLQAVG